LDIRKVCLLEGRQTVDSPCIAPTMRGFCVSIWYLETPIPQWWAAVSHFIKNRHDFNTRMRLKVSHFAFYVAVSVWLFGNRVFLEQFPYRVAAP
jgi:hypothetical protein